MLLTPTCCCYQPQELFKTTLSPAMPSCTISTRWLRAAAAERQAMSFVLVWIHFELAVGILFMPYRAIFSLPSLAHK